MVEPGDWGARRLEKREAVQRRRSRWLGGLAVFLAIGVPFVAGVIDGLIGNKRTMPEWSGPASAAIWAVVVVYACWLSWRDADEVERRSRINMAAAAGATGFLLFPLIGIFGPFIGLDDAGGCAWALSGVAALVVYIWQRGWA